ncbi:lysostaphin resistance A-like protein [Niallia sp. 03133]|uniref:lysostaphin resistance A-like protein n=1 Tax=Niallia sp. 03133 TaxID=3458060 RepID=UPI004043CF11
MFENSEGGVRSGWIILLAIAAMVFVQSICSIPGYILAFIMEAPNNLDVQNTADIMALLDVHPWLSLIAQGGGAAGSIIITFILWRFVNKKKIKELGFNRWNKDLGAGLLLGMASIIIIFVVLLVTNNIKLIHSITKPAFTSYTVSFLLVFILVGFFEEIFFRGYVMSTMENRGNPKWLIYVVSAILFSVMHVTNPNVGIFGLINIMLVGFLFAYMYDATKSLWLSIGYHITWNYFQGNVFGFPVSGTTPHGIYEVDVTEGSDFLTGGTFGLEGGFLATLLIFVGFMVIKLYTKKRDTMRA